MPVSSAVHPPYHARPTVCHVAWASSPRSWPKWPSHGMHGRPRLSQSSAGVHKKTSSFSFPRQARRSRAERFACICRSRLSWALRMQARRLRYNGSAHRLSHLCLVAHRLCPSTSPFILHSSPSAPCAPCAPWSNPSSLSPPFRPLSCCFVATNSDLLSATKWHENTRKKKGSRSGPIRGQSPNPDSCLSAVHARLLQRRQRRERRFCPCASYPSYPSSSSYPMSTASTPSISSILAMLNPPPPLRKRIFRILVHQTPFVSHRNHTALAPTSQIPQTH